MNGAGKMVIKNNFFVRILSAIALYFIFLSFIFFNYTNYSYIGLTLLFFVTVSYLFFHQRIHLGRLFFMPAFLFCLWVYGLLLGVFSGNKSIYIIHNFSGMSAYVFYFLLPQRIISNRFVIKTFYTSMWISVIVLMFVIFKNNAILSMVMNQQYWLVNLIHQHRVIHYQCGVYLPVVFSLVAAYFIFPSHKNKHLKVLFICIPFLVLSVVILSLISSKALWLVYLVNLSFIIYLLIEERLKSKGYRFLYVLVVAIALSFLAIFLAGPGHDGNLKRLAQLTAVFNNLTVFGHGLGAGLISYQASANTYNQEFEYVNIINQFGLLFGLGVFFCYLYTIYETIRLRFFNKQLSITCFFIVSSFIVMGFGDPVLFAPVYVILHCVILRIIERPHDFYK